MEQLVTNLPLVLNNSEDDVTSLPAPEPQTKKPYVYECTSYCDMDFDVGKNILWVFDVILLPSFGIFGLFGNISSLIVLKLQGLNKSSNILLFGLACSDLLYLIGCNNTYNVWRFYYKSAVSYQTAYNWYAVWASHSFCMEVGSAMSILLVVLVTMERLVAVYLPLKFTSIIRPFRTRIAVTLVFLFALIKGIIMLLRHSLQYNSRRRVPLIKKSRLYFEHPSVFTNAATAYDYILGFFPVLAVCTGSVLIGIKVSLAAAMRAKMLSNSGGEKSANQKAPARSSRTTKTLLTVCIMFTCTVGVGFGIENFMEFEASFKYFILQDRFTLVLYAINSSCNFLIYVLMNKNFRDTYVSILMPWKAASANSKKPGLTRTLTSNTMS